ncbi:hypothetical protein, partial [Paenibacillus sinopodophylli]|uniref:hypothetical protein n=1 Tax=Paenibacillus sinopodophylli TaxID=1837342 RepID=UPI001BB1F219
IVNVYKAATGGTAIGTATVGTGATTATVTITQLGATASSVYVSVVNDGKLESTRTVKAYDAEITAAPVGTTITATNNATGTADTVKVTGLAEGDIVNVYAAATGGTALDTATVASGATEVTISKNDLLTATGGTAYVSVTKANKLESARTAAKYATETVATAPLAATITATNNKAGVDDTVVVTGLEEGDIVNVYKAATGGTAIGTETVGTGATTATVTITQLGATASSVYVSVKKDGQLESTRTVKAYDAEITAAPVAATVTATNNATGTADTVKVTGLAEGDVVNVYAAATGGTALDTATVASGATEVTISKNDLLTATGGTAYVSVTKANKLESARTAAKYATETVATAPLAATITATNNKAGVDDTVVVTGLAEGDIVNVYAAATGGTAIGTATVGTGATTATITIEQLGVAAGSVFVSVKTEGQLESTRTAAKYATEPVSTAPLATTITATNNKAGVDDTVVVTGLVEGDIVNVYKAATGGTAIGTATVGTGATTATVTITQLGATASSVYVSVVNDGKLESTRTVKAYDAEITAAPAAATVIATNNATGTADTVKVTGLAEGDVVNVYAAATGGTALDTATVASGATEVTIS